MTELNEAVAGLEALLRAYGRAQCLLFAGAGFSSGASRKTAAGESAPLPAGRDLVLLLKEALNEDSDDLSALADLYEEKNGEHGLFQLLRENYVASSVTTSHLSMCSFRWKEIYTTNYDNVIELAMAQNGVGYSTYSADNRPSEIDRTTTPIIHINGYVVGASFATFRSEVRLTDAQYATDDFSSSAWGERFRGDILTSPCIVFAGYSMYDLDIARIIHEFEGMRDRIFFVVKEKPSRALERKLSHYGVIVPIGVDGLAALLDRIPQDRDDNGPPPIAAWERVTLPLQVPPAVRDVDVVSFLMSGSVDFRAFAHDIVSRRGDLWINRSASDRIVELMMDGGLSSALVTSNIGNGKSVAIDAIAVKLAARGVTVLRGISTQTLLLRDIPAIKQTTGRILLVLDDAFANVDLIKAVVSIGRDDVHIVAGARTSQFELQEGILRAAFGDVEQFDLNTLDDEEIASLVRLFDTYALWGGRQSDSEDAKKRFVRIDGARELRFVILDLLDSPNIKQRIQAIIGVGVDGPQRDRVRAVLVASQLLNLSQVSPDLQLIGEMLQCDARKIITPHAESIRDFALVRNGRISIRSPLFAEYVLRKLIDTPFVIDVMLSCIRRLDVIHDNSELYGSLFRQFSRFRFVESAISTEKRLGFMVSYFESVKTLFHAREHPLFWLQYAICRMSLSQYREAERLLDVSFSFSKKLGYVDNRHLNNQYAKFLLESRVNSDEYADYISAFNKAHVILVKQMSNEPLSYNPYRVARLYRTFVERRSDQLTTGELLAIFRSCGEALRHAERGRANISNTRGIEECIKALKGAMGDLRTKLKASGIDI